MARDIISSARTAASRLLVGAGAALAHLAAVVVAINPLLIPVAQAQSVKVDPTAPRSQQPGISRSGSGVPLINIAPPSSGVSHNRYEDLSTGVGAIFNNSTVSGTSRTGGAVPGNANLSGTGPANVILNEVRGGKVTSLKGALEIFGAKADLIIANENGVHCDGCAFVNTQRATLSTGRPSVSGANIALHVTDGIVGVWGQGASGADELELVGRHVVIDGPTAAAAGITASGGAQIYDHTTKTPRIAPSLQQRKGPYAVDGTALGAMTSGQIRIIGNESGLGVNLGGKVTARGNVGISSRGDATVREVDAGDTVSIEAIGSVKQPTGTVRGAKGVDVAANAIVIGKDARLISSGPVTLNLRAYANISGEVQGSSVDVIAPKSALNMGRIIAATNLQVVAGEISNRRDVSGSTVTYAEAWLGEYTPWMKWYIQQNPGEWTSRYYQGLISRGDVTLASGAASGLSEGRIHAGQDVTLNATGQVYNTGIVTAVRDLTVSAGTDIVNTVALTRSGQVCSGYGLGCGTAYTANYAQMYAGRNATLKAGQDIVNRGSYLHAAGDVSLAAGRDIRNEYSAIGYGWSTSGSSSAWNRAYSYANDYYKYGDYTYGWWWYTYTYPLTTYGYTWNGFTDTTTNYAWDRSSVRYTGLSRAHIYSSAGDVSATAGRDIANDGSYLYAPKSLSVDAGRNLSLASTSYIDYDWASDRVNQISYHYARNRAGGYSLYQGAWWTTVGFLTDGYYYAGASSYNNANNRYTYYAGVGGAGSTVVGGQDVALYARGGSLTLPHAISTARDVTLLARDGISNAHGINAGRNLAVTSVSGAISNPSHMVAGGTASLRAGSAIDSRYLASNGDLSVRAGAWIWNRDYMGSSLGKLDVYGGSDLYNYDPNSVAREAQLFGRTGVDIDVAGNIHVIYGGAIRSSGDVNVTSRAGSIYLSGAIVGTNHWSSYSGAPYGREVWSNGWQHQVRYASITGRNLNLSAKYDVALTAGWLSASGDLSVEAGRDFVSTGVNYQHYQYSYVRDWRTYSYVASRTCTGRFWGWCYSYRDNYATAWTYDDSVSSSNPTYTLNTVLRGNDVSITAGSLSAGRLDVIARNDLGITTTAGALGTSGAVRLQATRDILLAARTALDVDGPISEGRDLYLTSTAGGITFNTDLTASRDLVINAFGTVTNYATLRGGRSLLVTTTAGHIQNLASTDYFTLTSAHGCYGAACGRRGFAYTPAQMIAGAGGLILNARYDILNRASTIQSAGDMRLTAGRDLVNEAMTGAYAIRDYSYYDVDKTWYGKKTTTQIIDYLETAVLRSGVVTAGGDLMVTVGQDLKVYGSSIRATGSADLMVGRNVELVAQAAEIKRLYSYQQKSGLWGFISLGSALSSAESNTFTNAYASIEGRQVWLHASGNLYAEGARLRALQGLTLTIWGNIIITPFKTEHYNKVVANKSGFLGTGRNEFEYTENRTVISSTQAAAGRDLTFESVAGNVVLQAASLQAGGDLTLSAKNGQILMLVDKETKYVNTQTYTESLVWWKSVEKGSYSEDIVHNHLRAGGRIVFDAGKGVYVEFADGKGTVDEAIRTLSRKPELAWMADLQIRNDVEWNAVKAKFDQWNYKAEGLTQGAAALIALAVTIATQGAGTALLAGAGITVSGPMAAAINAGFSTLASRATVSLINNKGDLGKVFKELGSNAFLKSLATSMLTAGLTAGLPTDILPVAPPGETLSFQQMLQANIVRNAIGVTVGTAIQGGDLGDSLSNALIQAAVQSVGAQGAIAIGAAVGSNDMNKAFQLLAHAALGCAIGTATTGTRDGGKGCVGGAVGGVTGELMADFLRNQLLAGNLEFLTSSTLNINGEQVIINGGKLAGAMGAFLVGGDVNVGGMTGANAAEHNALGAVRMMVKVARALMAAANSPAGLTAQGVLAAFDAAGNIGTLLDANASNFDKVVAGIFLALDAFGIYLSATQIAALKSQIRNACPGGACLLGTCSFRGDTQVLTQVGYKPIRDIRPGEHVWSREDRSGRMAFQSVLRQYSNPYPDTVYITLRDVGTGAEQTIVSNRIHPFFVQRLEAAPELHLVSARTSNSEGHVYQGDIPGGAWVDADHLRTGDRLLQSDEEWSEVVSVRVVPEPLKAYNLTVAHSHTFYVRAGDAGAGADAVWVHNCNPLVLGAIKFAGRNADDVVRDLNTATKSRPANGQWIKSGESPGGAGAAWEAQVTGVPKGYAFQVNGVKFDGINNGRLVDAKDWLDWPKPHLAFSVESVVSQATAQLRAAGNTPIDWVFSNAGARDSVATILQNAGIRGITLR